MKVSWKAPKMFVIFVLIWIHWSCFAPRNSAEVPDWNFLCDVKSCFWVFELSRNVMYFSWNFLLFLFCYQKQKEKSWVSKRIFVEVQIDCYFGGENSLMYLPFDCVLMKIFLLNDDLVTEMFLDILLKAFTGKLLKEF